MQLFTVQLGLIADITYARRCRVAVGTLADPDVASHHTFLPVFGQFSFSLLENFASTNSLHSLALSYSKQGPKPLGNMFTKAQKPQVFANSLRVLIPNTC